MEFLAQLWLPIVVSSVALFVISAFAWMGLPHHRQDYQPLADEDRALQAIRGLNIPPGRYTFPFFGSNQNQKDPEFQRKFKEGPVGLITVLGPMTMGKNMAWTFIFFLIASTLLAYLGWIVFEGASRPPFMRLFRIMGTAGVLTYTCAGIPNDIWFKRPCLTNVIDGVVYGIVTGLIFAGLWPAP